jgi:succinate dehydrogenase / fumarate reductase cytochrome b subunit
MDKPRRAWLGVTKKIVMAVTGLGLCLFLVGHLAGNLLLLFPANQYAWFNVYATTLNKLPVLPLIELGLAAMFLLHAYEGLMVWRQNKAARPIEYQGGRNWTKEKSKKSRKTTSSTTMMVTGLIIIIFTSVHVWQMKYHNSIGSPSPTSQHKAGEPAPAVGVTGAEITPAEAQTPAQSAEEVYDLANHVIWELKKPPLALLYMACMLALGFHLYHAVWSAFQSLGATNSNFRRFMLFAGKAFSVVIAGSFFLLPVYIWLFVEAPK